MKLLIDDDWGIVETLSGNEKAFGYRFYPDKVRGEGFFIAAFRKPGAGKPELGVGSGEYEVFSGEQGVKKSKNRSAILSAAELDIIKPFVNNADDYFFIRQEEEIIALPGHLQKELPVIKSALYIKKAGVKIGTVIRNELIPDHQLALSTIINLSVKRIEVDKETALCYLRREEIKLETTITGWTLISYQDLPLGWIKILPNRINNYYPKEWRILNK